MNNTGYTEGNSFLHKRDAFIKLLCFILLLATVILADNTAGFVLSFLCLVPVILLSSLSFDRITSGIKNLVPFLIFIVLLNFAFFDRETAFFSPFIFSFSVKGLLFGLKTVLRVLSVMLAANVFIAVTTPTEIISALETLIFPLKFIGVPVRDVAMILGVAFQFVPVLLREAESIKTAQTARGALFSGEKLSDRAKSLVPLVVPVFVSAFRRADELACSMEARGYVRKKGAWRPRKRHIVKEDVLYLVFSLFSIAMAIIFHQI